ncbi:MAG: DoxX family protein [Kiritimatiellia bacterium]
MKKYLFSTGTTALKTDLGLLSLRLMFGIGMLVAHGWGKLLSFGDRMDSFPDPLGISSPVSLAAVVFAEVFCAALVSIGLFTRAALIPLIFTMGVAAFVIHGGDSFADKEMALLYLVSYLTLFLTGPGKLSLDHKLR